MNLSKNLKKIIVNLITSSRIVGALFLPVIFNFLSIPALITTLSILLVTDFVDGKLSRFWKVQTRGGALLDACGDKLLAFSCVLSLISTHGLLVVPLFLELGISAVNVYKTFKGEVVNSTILGKIKTAVLSLCIILCAINVLNPALLENALSNFLPSDYASIFNISDSVVDKFIGITAITEAATLADYVIRNNTKKIDKDKKIEELKSLKEILIRLFDESKYEEDKEKPLIKILKK